MQSEWTETEGRKLGGRAYLVSELAKHGCSRRRAVRIVNAVFREMGLALQRGEYVEFPFGYLMAEKRMRQYWWDVGDEPMRPWFIEHKLDDEGERRLEGEGARAWPPGWSRDPKKYPDPYLRYQFRDRSRKRTAKRRQSAKKSSARAKQVKI
jgi:hypothetical protein